MGYDSQFEEIDSKHNQPKLKEPRIPFLLTDALADDWLSSNENKDEIISLIQPYAADKIIQHTVR